MWGGRSAARRRVKASSLKSCLQFALESHLSMRFKATDRNERGIPALSLSDDDTKLAVRKLVRPGLCRRNLLRGTADRHR